MKNCKKVRYNDQEQAIQDIHLISNLDTNTIKPQRTYYCTHCKGYHITKTSIGVFSKQIKLKYKADWNQLLKRQENL